ncbi:MAG: nitrate- and nitrite sensing domain-containing protein [Pseudonocardia sp.]|nr:nitrate- and nitrite sensing domain-containing protein [Pseudonocardia sp.]
MTSTETGPSWSERLTPRNWTLTAKLVLIGLVPALLALTLGVLRVADQAGTAAELGRSSRLLETREEVAEAASALRDERHESTRFASAGRNGDPGVMRIGFAKGQAEVEEMLAAVRSASEFDPTTFSALQRTETELSQLTRLRDDTVDTAAVGSDKILERYGRIIEAIDVLDRALLRQLRTPGTAGLADALTAVTDATEQLALQHTLVGVVIESRRSLPADESGAEFTAAVNDTEARLASNLTEYTVALTPDQLTRARNFIDDPASQNREQVKDSILALPPDSPIVLDIRGWDTAYNGSEDSADDSANVLRQELVGASVVAEEQASNQAGINSVILMLGLLAGITIAVLIARALIRSLRVLRTAALDVAERRLPQAVESLRAGETPDVTVDPVPITTRDEVGQVARAFDAVHGQAVRLAADQASLQSNVSAMFVNLSRRSQALVERQLQLIEQLESNEQDADQLSNLFQLDHLATRMRRNSENLLVLAGTDLAKRNIAPVPMVDVLRAAVSEVEQYQRIVVQAPPTTTIVGRAASDLVHLLAELLDNATNFSPPDSQVVMSTTRTSDGSIVVEIADRGVGMIEHELGDANQRLGGPSTVDVSASRRMGLFVVGRLGARHGIGVRLSATGAAGSGGGLTASVTVPAYLVPTGERGETGRPIGVLNAAGIPAQGRPGALPPTGTNGGGRTGSLSALVAGSDGSDGSAPPLGNGGQFGGPPVNGTAAGLPTRQPGSSLRPEVPGRPPEPPEPAGPGPDRNFDRDARRAAAERAAEQAREVADQARRDQEAAERTARDRAARDRVARERAVEHRDDRPDTQHDTGGNDLPRNGGQTNGAIPMPGAPSQAPPAGPADGDSAFGTGQNAARPTEQDADRHDGPRQPDPRQPDPRQPDTRQPGTRQPDTGRQTRPDEQQPSTFQESFPDGAFGNGELPKRDREAPPPVRLAPPTSPVPLVGRADTVMPQRPAPNDPQPERFDGPRPHPQRSPHPGSSGPLNPPAPTRSPDEQLFAPNVPVIAEPEAAAHDHTGDAERSDEFDLGESTPIFAEIASAWFRSNRPVPVTWETEQDGAAPPQPATAPAAATAPPVPMAPAAPVTPTWPPRPADPARESHPVRSTAPIRESLPVRRPAPVREPAPFSRTPDPELEPATAAATSPAARAADQEFASVADAGWQAARGIESDRPDELTSAGLPKRRPRARLVPGSAGSAVMAPPVSAGRSAENIRGRLASYQQGVRQGRESRSRSDSGDTGTAPAPAGGHHDEEPS